MRRKRKGIFVFFVLLFLIGTAAPLMSAKASGGKLAITEIDYEKETITVTSTNGDQYLYYSDAKMKNWECAYGSFANGTFVLDISWVSKTKDYVLTLKGDKSDEAVSVTLPKQDRSFRATYNFMTESFSYVSAEGRTVFWRKADSTTWQPVDGTTQKVLQRLYARGASIYLRAGQVKGGTANGALNAGSRPSKEVKISLTKQAAAPSVTVKSADQISVNDKMEYMAGGASAWTPCGGKVLKISEVAADVFYNGSTPGRDVDVKIRVAATEKKLPSAAAVLTIRAQEAAPTGIENEFTNATTLQITIPEKKDEEGNVIEKKPSSSNPYEYTIVAKDATLSENAVWTAITAEKTSLTSQKAPQGSVVYIRKRGRMDGSSVYQPSSQAFTLTVGEYPGGSTVTLAGAASDAAFLDTDGKVVCLVKPEGEKIGGLTFKITVAAGFDTDVSSITCGGKALTFETVKSGQDIIVTITETDKYESEVTTRDEAKAVKITLKNGEVLDKEVTLKVLHGASVEKEKSFTVMHGVTPESDYEFTVIPGLKLDKDADGKHLTTQITAITLLKTNISYTVSNNTDGSYKVVLDPASFDALFMDGSVEADKAYPLNIKMENGQTITSGVTVKLTEEAVVSSASHFLVKMESSVLEEDIVIQLTSTKANVYVVSAEWNGTDIMGNCTGGDKAITVKLSYEKLNALRVPDGETLHTAPVVFTLSDGAKVSMGYQITLKK